jgi:hypothetical protein
MADDKIGALWIKEKDGKVYMTGDVNGVQVVVFRNTYKAEGSREPDWRVFKSKPREVERTVAPVEPPVADDLGF